jgi:hypothetical protein
MKTMSKALWVSIFFIMLSTSCSSLVGIDPKVQANKFLSAVKNRNIDIIYEMVSPYQEYLTQMKQSKPQSLWPKMDADFRNAVQGTLLGNKYLAGVEPNPSGNIKELIAIITPLSQWNINEVRYKKGVDILTGKQYNHSIVFVSIKNKGDNIIELTFDSNSGLLVWCRRIEN